MKSADTFEEQLATPIVLFPGMNESDFRHEFTKMRVRASATADFVRGELDTEDFLEVLADCGVDIDTVLADWSRGQSYMS